jgi:hypothetical protein
MTRFAQLFTRSAVVATLAASALLCTERPAAASSGDSPNMLWMAASGSEPSIGSNWGRLMLKDGVLRFRSTSAEWQLALTDIKRAQISSQSDQLIVLESVAGQTYYVAILGQNLLVDSPRKALQVIQKASASATPGARRER